MPAPSTPSLQALLDNSRRDEASVARELARRVEAARALDPSAAERRAQLDAIHRLAESYTASLDRDAPSYVAPRDEPERLLERLAVPERALPLDEILERLERDVLEPGGHPASPGHFAYITGGGLHSAALADYFSAATNKFAGLAATGPGPARMEQAVVRWTADLVGLPETAGGHIASGGSLATLAALVAARDAHRLRGADIERSVVYLSEQAHHCVHKALHVAGLGEVVHRVLPLGEHLRPRPCDLARAIAADRERGLRPWLVVATAGTTDTGTIDPLPQMAQIAADEGCWFHVDAAYGGAFLLTEVGRERLRGIERADSVILDPHKSLFLPWGAGIVLTRDAHDLARAHAGSGDYLQDAAADTAPRDLSPADLSPELTKPFRALRIWLPIALAGIDPFRAALEEKLLLARYAYESLSQNGFQVGPPPDLSTLTFRWVPPGTASESESEDEIEAANRAIAAALRRDGRIFLSTTRVRGRYTLRLCVLGFRAHRDSVDLAVRLLTEAARDMKSTRRKTPSAE